MTDLRLSRRALLLRFESPGKPAPLSPEARGRALARVLFTGRVHDAYFPVARPWPAAPEELVHDARVACRRLVEALALAAPLLGKKAARRAGRRARALRQALGAAREADVMRADLLAVGREVALPEASLLELAEQLGGHRAKAPDPRRRYPPERLYRFGLDLLEQAEGAADRSLSELAAVHLRRRAIALRPFLLSVLEPGEVPAHHRLRVRLKQLRYTVELLAQPYAELLQAEARLASLKQLQDALGELNDASDLLLWLGSQALPEPLRPLIGAVEARRDARYEVARRRVLEQAPLLSSDLERVAQRIADG